MTKIFTINSQVSFSVVEDGTNKGDVILTLGEDRNLVIPSNIWASLVLNMSVFNERPNDWQAFMDHHLGRVDLMDAAKQLQTIKNVLSRMEKKN